MRSEILSASAAALRLLALSTLCTWAATAQTIQLPNPFTTSARTSISAAPLLDLGGLRDDPREELHPSLPYLIGKPLSDGRWVVADNGSIKVFDRDGRFVRAMGRSGDGPGEMRLLRDVCVIRGDTILAVSLGDRRLVVFDSSGRHLRTRSVDGEIRRGGCMPDGNVLVLRDETRPGQSESGVRSLRVLITRWSSDEYTNTGVSVTESLDYTIQSFASVIGLSNRFVVTNSERERIEMYDGEGSLVRALEWPAARDEVTDAMRREAIRRGYRVSGVQRRWLPVHGALQVSTSGEIWMQQYGLPWAPSRTYARIDPERESVSLATLPSLPTTRVDIAWVGTDRILLAWRDEDGGPHLTLHQLR